ncbi:MAG: hypothetical protein K6G56_07615 [Clostridiales bacterium]|nr:hypothetical protein [Clostridiales bacterium]
MNGKLKPIITVLLAAVFLIAALLFFQKTLPEEIAEPIKAVTDRIVEPIKSVTARISDPGASDPENVHDTVIGTVTVREGSIVRSYSFWDHDLHSVTVGTESQPVTLKLAFAKSRHMVNVHVTVERGNGEWLISGTVVPDGGEPLSYSKVIPAGDPIIITIDG